MKKFTGFIITLLVLLLTWCAPTKKIWTSDPAFQSADNSYFKARIEPIKRDSKDRNFFVLFRLTIINKTDKNLEIDWNKTRYILNGMNYGRFVFQGVDPEALKNLTIPFDTIPAGINFSKEIAPLKLIGKAPLRDRSVGVNQSSFSPGIIPEGENGIYLVVRYSEKEVREKIMLTIKSETVQ